MAGYEILTLEEVADYLRVSERTVYDWANKGEIPCGKLGTTWRFKRSDVEAWVDNKLSQPKKPVRSEAVILSEVLTPERVLLLDCSGKAETLNAIVDCLAAAPQVKNVEELRREVFDREELMSTGIVFGIGVPHVRLASVRDLVVAVGVNRREIVDYTSLDEGPVQIVFMVAARNNQHTQYLKALAAISTLTKDATMRDALLAAKDRDEVFELLTEND